VHTHHLGLPVGVGTEVKDARAGPPLGDVVFFVACHPRHGKALHQIAGLAAVAVDDVVDGAAVVLLEDTHMDDVLADERLVGHPGDDIASVAQEDDHIIDVGTFGDELVFLEAGAHEALLAVDIETGVGHSHLGGDDGLEVAYLGLPGISSAVFLPDLLVVVDGVIVEVGQVVLHLLQLLLDGTDSLLGFLDIIFGDTLDLYLRQVDDVVVADLAEEEFLEGCQPLVDGLDDRLPGLALLYIAVDPVLDEDLLQRREVPGLFELALAYLQLTPQEVLGLPGRPAQDLFHPHEVGFVAVDDAGVGGDRHLAVGEGIEGVDGLVGRHARRQVDDDLHMLGRVVVDLLHLDLALVVGLDD